MPDPSRLTDHTGYWLRMVSNAVSQEFARKVAGQGVTVAEWVCLRALLGETGLAPSALADRMGMTRGAISKLADRLVAKGLVARRESESDGRGQYLSLTEAGQAVTPALAALADVNDQDFFGVLAPEERATLERLLRTLADRHGLHATPID